MNSNVNPSEILGRELQRLSNDIKTIDGNIQRLHNHFSLWIENVDMVAFAALMMLVNDGKYELNEDSMKLARDKIDEISEQLKEYREKLKAKQAVEDKPKKKSKILAKGKKNGGKIITK